MATKVYVGNLNWGTTDDSLRAAFARFGRIVDHIVMRERETGRSRGFGFVTYESEQEAERAIAAMDNRDFEGRTIKVNLASPKPGSVGGPAVVAGGPPPPNPPNLPSGRGYPPSGGFQGVGGSNYGAGQPPYPPAGGGGYGPGYQPSSYGQGGYPQQGPYPPGGYGSGRGY